jgi:hypothetical protein
MLLPSTYAYLGKHAQYHVDRRNRQNYILALQKANIRRLNRFFGKHFPASMQSFRRPLKQNGQQEQAGARLLEDSENLSLTVHLHPMHYNFATCIRRSRSATRDSGDEGGVADHVGPLKEIAALPDSQGRLPGVLAWQKATLRATGTRNLAASAVDFGVISRAYRHPPASVASIGVADRRGKEQQKRF